MRKLSLLIGISAIVVGALILVFSLLEIPGLSEKASVYVTSFIEVLTAKIEELESRYAKAD